MRTSVLCLLSLVIVGAAACGNKDSDTNPGGGGLCSAESLTTSAIALSSRDPVDPFLSRGKVLLEALATRSLMTQSMARIEAGSEFSVTLRESCTARGPISRAVHAQNPPSQAGATRSGLRSYHFKLPFDSDLDGLRELAENDACVYGIADEHVSSFMADARGPADDLLSDPLVKQQAHLAWLQASIGYDTIFAQSAKNPVVIAVIDTGIDLNHEDLRHVLWKNPREIPGNKIDDDHNGYIDDVHGYNFATRSGDPSYSSTVTAYQHGSHVSGLAAAQGGSKVGGSGVMGNGAKIMSLNVFAPKSSGADSSNIADAIRYAADNGANVINISLGGDGRSATYESALAYAIGKGVAIMAAAGNSHRELGPNSFMSPAGYALQFDGMIAVASLDTVNGELSSFSNYSVDYVELAAPGSENSRKRVGLLSTYPGDRYGRSQGTSMSSPVAAGAAAIALSMMWSRGYEPSAATIEKLLAASAQTQKSLQNYVRAGRALNLKLLAEYIDLNYPKNGGSPTDPGVPGFKTCGDR